MKSTWSSSSSKRKGKERARDEGDGGNNGIVISLDMVGSGIFDVSYSVPIRVGRRKSQKVSLQVDTGSSDLWIASTSCSTPPCSAVAGHTYDPSGSQPTGVSFDINYMQGNVSGPVVWDQIEIGGYNISNQALAAADNVDKEVLTPLFSGILGLALPRNSIIADLIPPVTSNSPDGAPFSSNIFGITPDAPSAHFLSLSLSRPGSDRVPSSLGIGRHPSALVPDPSKVRYSTLASDSNGPLFWKAIVKAITVWVDGQEKPVSLGSSNSGAPFQDAVLDSGVPLILTTSDVANGIYGALGIAPTKDGKYYVPCKTPLNMTITLDDRPPIPLHPLDLTAQPPQSPSSTMCIGLIQSADSQLNAPNSLIGDMILGVPFLRNTYMVMAYDTPDLKGNFGSSPPDGGTRPDARPRLGLLPLTDPQTGLDEFHQVRVLNQPLGPGGSHSASTEGKKMSVGVNVLIGLLSFFAFSALIFALRWLMVKRRWGAGKGVPSSSLRDVRGGVGGYEEKRGRGWFGMRGYKLARRHSGEGEDIGMTEDELRMKRFEAYMMKERKVSEYTMSSGLTRVGEEDEFGYLEQDPTSLTKKRGGMGVGANAFDSRDQKRRYSPSSLRRTTLVGIPEVTHPPDELFHQRRMSKELPLQPYLGDSSVRDKPLPPVDPLTRHSLTNQPLEAYQDFSAGGRSDHRTPDPPMEDSFDPYRDLPASAPDRPTHQRQQPSTDMEIASYSPKVHRRTASEMDGPQELTSPLLSASASYFPSYSQTPHTRNYSGPYVEPYVDEFGMLLDTHASPTEEGGGTMVGVGTAMRSSRLDAALHVDSSSIKRYQLFDAPVEALPVESPVEEQHLNNSQSDQNTDDHHGSQTSYTRPKRSPTGPRGSSSISSLERTL